MLQWLDVANVDLGGPKVSNDHDRKLSLAHISGTSHLHIYAFHCLTEARSALTGTVRPQQILLISIS